MKFMNKKRFASLALAGVMTASLAVPALAEDQSTVITATYADIELSVTVPANTNAQINPYGLPVTMEDAVTSISGQPITIATPLMIENQSSVALKVGANVKTEVTGLALASAESGVAAGTAKEAYVELQLFKADGIDGATSADPTTTNPAYAALENDDAVLSAVLTTGASGVDAAKTGTDELILREGADGLAQNGGVAFVRLSGVVAKKPTTAWATTDKLVATITYSFEPNTYTKSAGTLVLPANIAATGTTTGVATLTLPAGVTPNADGLEWTSSDSDFTVTDASASGTYKANLTNNGVAATGTVDITVSFTGTDGIVYTTTETLTIAS